MEIPKTFISKKSLEGKTEQLQKNEIEKQKLKKYVMQVYSQQFESCGWVCSPDIYYLGIEAQDDEEAYQKAVAYEILRWRENSQFSDVFVTNVESIHGLEHSFSSYTKDQVIKTLKQKTDSELERILGEKEYIKNKRDIYKYVAGVD